MPLPPLTPLPSDALTEALDSGAISTAEYALERARSVFALRSVRDEFGDVERVDSHAATLVLRDLSLRLPALDAEEEALAVDILERPTEGGSQDPYLEYTVEEAPPIDTAHFRIHYVTSSDDRSTASYAAQVSQFMEEVWAREVTTLGWTAPKPDGSRGGGENKFDVYLGNVGADSLYGYCSVDPGQRSPSQHSYCVLDNGFTEFRGTSADAAAKVTAAHEFNHALHFTYDVTDDPWFMEATATWMEDEVYDDIDDNYQYLGTSALSHPEVPADTWAEFMDPTLGGFQYGQFVWLRYLSESRGPGVIRDIWEKTASVDVYSLEAIAAVVGGRNGFANRFADFAAVNAKPSLFYEEGTRYESIVAPPRTLEVPLAAGVPVTGAQAGVDHLTSRYISFRPQDDVAADAPITIAVDVGTRPMQRATVVGLTGTTMTTKRIVLTDGEGHVTVPFGDQSEVVLVLTNGSNRLSRCSPWSGRPYSCGGSPVDDNRSFTYAAVTGAKAVKPPEPVTAPRVRNLTASPKVISPNGDGFKDSTKITFDLVHDGAVTLSIVKNGKVVAPLARNEPLDAGSYWIRWSGRSAAGRVVKNGTYTVKLKAVIEDVTIKKTSVTVRS